MAHMADWEKKRDKLNRKQEKARQVSRLTEKEDKKQKKELERIKEKQRDVQLPAEVQSKVRIVQAVAGVVVIGVYVASVVSIMNGSMPAASESMTAVLTALLAVLLTTVVGVGSCWRQALIRKEIQQEAAKHIKWQLERKETEQERADKQKQRRAQQVKQLKEQQRRRVEQEAASLQQVKEIARMLKRRREEREAEEARAAKAAAATQTVDDQNKDNHGWSQSQYLELRIAVAKYPESWSHARKKRWEMIAEEVNGQNARNCEAAFIRLEEEGRAAAAEAKAEGRKSAEQPEAQRNSLEEDLDWMGDDTSTVDAGAAVDFEAPDDSEEDDDAGEDRVRMAVELEPEHKGTEIRLENINAMQGCACVQLEVLHLQVSCVDCKASGPIFLSGASEDAAEAKTWCEGCSGLISVRLRPTLVHQSSMRLCYVDCVRCNIVDVLPSVLMTTCEVCDAENVHKQEFVRNRVVHGTCTQCHSKYAFGAEAIRIVQVTPCDTGGKGAMSAPKSSLTSSGDSGDPMDEIAEELRWLRKKAKADPKQQMIQLGRQLPQMGACSHFKKSYKWYRFGCCGRAFPCPECHAESGCPAAALGSHATRMICGKCSMEQAYSPARPCEECGFAMQARGSSHWEDGGGTRNLAVMSTKDAKKFKGGLRQSNSKAKTSSSKGDRVGAKAKANREYAKKFGTSA